MKRPSIPTTIPIISETFSPSSPDSVLGLAAFVGLELVIEPVDGADVIGEETGFV